MKIYPNPTEQQFETLKILRTRFAEKGYYIAEVHEKYRRHECDFVILPKDDLQQFSIVRAAGKFVVVRPFGVRRNDVIQMLKRIRKSLRAPIMHAAPLLRYVRGRADLWRHFVATSQHDEIETLSLRVSK